MKSYDSCLDAEEYNKRVQSKCCEPKWKPRGNLIIQGLAKYEISEDGI